ncbi:MAG: hypothetical protein JNM17_25570 [Archangium sp.]|nr:hypothetical protein [Archangium sp.]
MADRDSRERDILVASNEYAYVQDLTKGDIVLYVGPTKISLSNTERLVELKNDRFLPVRNEEGTGVQAFVTASSAQYVVLENPAKDATVKPVKGNNSAVELQVGRRVVVPGPATFPLWPGQKARVVAGHELSEDQYLRLRVYDAVEGEKSVIGTERIIKGSEVSFFIPRTGLEVLAEEKGGYVRNAVTLLDGQYCVLRGPKGRRRYERGPAVVFPEAWEEFLIKNGGRVFAAWPLKRDRGLHVRVLQGFEAKDGDAVPAGRYEAGQELFVHAREGYFFPNESVEVLGEVAAVQLAAKEAVYLRDLHTGAVRTVEGPAALLPDPTQVERVTRALDVESSKRWKLGKHDASRAPTIVIPPGEAVLVTGTQSREVVRGPAVRVLAFDETLETLELSTGTPKSADALLATCFLRVEGNKVSDMVKVRTADHVELEVKLSYRVSFVHREGVDDARWFSVPNYVGLLCDHLGSLVRAAVRMVGIERFHAASAEILRTAVLGEKKAEKRAGREFDENGMSVYDVEVLDVSILDEAVETLLTDAQRTAITAEVARKREQLRLATEETRESVARAIWSAQRETLVVEAELEVARRAVQVAKVEAKAEAQRLEALGRARADAEALGVRSTAESASMERRVAVERQQLDARAAAFKEQMAALHPELVATLKTLGAQQFSASLTQNLSPLAILGGDSVADVAKRLLSGLPLGWEGVRSTWEAPREQGQEEARGSGQNEGDA